MENIFELLQRYKNANIGVSLEQEREIIAKYIYSTNKLEGNIEEVRRSNFFILDNDFHRDYFVLRPRNDGNTEFSLIINRI